MKKITAFLISVVMIISAFSVLAESVSGEELYKEAIAALTAKKTEEGLTLLEQAYAAGYEKAAKDLADICFNNRQHYLVEPDYDRALTYGLIAAEMGDDMSYINVGQIYLYGYGTVQADLDQALECFLKAVSSQNQQAQMKAPRWVGLAYEMKGDYESAYSYYVAAYEKGDISGTIFLALLYLHGNAVDQDIEKALAMLEQVMIDNSKNQKAGDAAIELGRIYETGDEVETDLEAAQVWYQKGADMGNADAKAEMDRFMSEHAN